MIVNELKKIERQIEVLNDNISEGLKNSTYTIDKYQKELMDIMNFFVEYKINCFTCNVNDVEIFVTGKKALGTALIKISLTDTIQENDISIEVDHDNVEFDTKQIPVKFLGVKNFTLSNYIEDDDKKESNVRLLNAFKTFIKNRHKYMDEAIEKERNELIQHITYSSNVETQNDILILKNLQNMILGYEKGKELEIIQPEKAITPDFTQMSVKELYDYSRQSSLAELTNECVILNDLICKQFSNISKIENSILDFFKTIVDVNNAEEYRAGNNGIVDYEKDGFHYHVTFYHSLQMNIAIFNKENVEIGNLYYWHKSKCFNGRMGDFMLYLNIISSNLETNGLTPETLQSFLEAINCLETNWQEIMVDGIFKKLKAIYDERLIQAKSALEEVQKKFNHIDSEYENKRQNIMNLL